MTIVHKPKTNRPDTQYRCLDRSIVRARPQWCVALESNLSTLISQQPRPLHSPALKHARSARSREKPRICTWSHGDRPDNSYGIPKRHNF